MLEVGRLCDQKISFTRDSLRNQPKRQTSTVDYNANLLHPCLKAKVSILFLKDRLLLILHPEGEICNKTNM